MPERATYLVACPSCGTANRVPAESEGKSGRCGNCRQPLPALHTSPLAKGDRDFADFVAAYRGPILAEFWAPW